MDHGLFSLLHPVLDHGLIRKLAHKGDGLRIFLKKRKTDIPGEKLPQKAHQKTGNLLRNLTLVLRKIFDIGKAAHLGKLLASLHGPVHVLYHELVRHFLAHKIVVTLLGEKGLLHLASRAS